MLENHYEQQGVRAMRAASDQRAVVPRERRIVDGDMGQSYLVGGARASGPETAGLCMTFCPYEAPKRAVPAPAAPAASAPSPPKYDAAAEAERLRRRSAAEDRWASGEGGCLPRGELPLSARRLAPRSSRGESPFATDATVGARADDASAKPRGRARGPLGVSDASPVEVARRGRRGAPEDSRAASSAFAGGGVAAPDGADGLMCAALGSADAYAIGNPRAENFVLRTRATKRVGIAPPAHSAESNYADRAPGRRVFSDQHGGGRSTIGFDDGGGGGLSAAASPPRPARRPVDRSPPKPDDRVRGRKHGNYERDDTDAGMGLYSGREVTRPPFVHDGGHDAAPPPPQAPPPAAERPPDDFADRLRHFAAWYAETYGEEPSRDALQHAAAQLLSEPAGPPSAPQHREPAPTPADYGRRAPAPPSGPPPAAPAAPPPNPAPSVPANASAREFVAWYVGEYGAQPPQNLVDRAATSFAVSGETVDRAPARKPEIAGNDPFRHPPAQRRPAPFGVDPPTTKHAGPRCGAIGNHEPGKNSILGSRSIKTTRPPGGNSSISLSWD